MEQITERMFHVPSSHFFLCADSLPSCLMEKNVVVVFVMLKHHQANEPIVDGFSAI